MMRPATVTVTDPSETGSKFMAKSAICLREAVRSQWVKEPPLWQGPFSATDWDLIGAVRIRIIIAQISLSVELVSVALSAPLRPLPSLRHHHLAPSQPPPCQTNRKLASILHTLNPFRAAFHDVLTNLLTCFLSGDKTNFN
uniref:HDC13484 n=1 Tax=Drosophila melanogaster TaxID=7227 RepID=Q6IK28_DROME|nr:TPA_inf: HDC13484 [Drosophila melanogaster]